MDAFHLEIITPQRAYPARDAVSVDVPAESGRLTVLPGHMPYVCCLAEGTVEVGVADGTRETWTIGEGTMTVEGDTVTILAQRAEGPAPPGSGAQRQTAES
jgi:F-type H+-transporting ATPase subunit epsilon